MSLGNILILLIFAKYWWLICLYKDEKGRIYYCKKKRTQLLIGTKMRRRQDTDRLLRVHLDDILVVDEHCRHMNW